MWLASVRDAFANRIVGWATDPRATTTLVLTALNHALRSRDVRARQLIFHSDKGAQYTALRFTQRLIDAGVAPSTGSTGDSIDNALAENLWSTIKVELLYWPGATFATRTEAEHALVRNIDGWYNPRRIQAGLGGSHPTSTKIATIAHCATPTDNPHSGKPGEPQPLRIGRGWLRSTSANPRWPSWSATPSPRHGSTTWSNAPSRWAGRAGRSG